MIPPRIIDASFGLIFGSVVPGMSVVHTTVDGRDLNAENQHHRHRPWKRLDWVNDPVAFLESDLAMLQEEGFADRRERAHAATTEWVGISQYDEKGDLVL